MKMVKLSETVWVNAGAGSVTHVECGSDGLSRVYFAGGEYVAMLECVELVARDLNSHTVDPTFTRITLPEIIDPDGGLTV
ncbi:MAG: hypothetical protein ACI88C_000016 [Acidimicrobiales bacterium]|jgi:hypothetical protein